ncbi:unnamed protein product [Caenorhabditis sp. 36 PRJEB53466]|nr:unnamed protein product [Caenorhabditis sp. 36 PRJEB53466]
MSISADRRTEKPKNWRIEEIEDHRSEEPGDRRSDGPERAEQQKTEGATENVCGMTKESHEGIELKTVWKDEKRQAGGKGKVTAPLISDSRRVFCSDALICIVVLRNQTDCTSISSNICFLFFSLLPTNVVVTGNTKWTRYHPDHQYQFFHNVSLRFFTLLIAVIFIISIFME